MYNNIHYDKWKNLVHIWDDEKGYSSFQYTPYCYVKTTKETKLKSIYGDNVVEKYVDDIFESDIVFESDVNVELKILVDLYYNSDTPPKNNKIYFFDIETDSKSGFPNFETFDKEILSITLREFEKHSYVFLTDPLNRFTLQSDNSRTFFVFDTEKEMLKAIVSHINKEKPTIISGWNSENFDIPYTIGRGKKIIGNIINKISPIGIISDYFSKDKKKQKIAGLNHLDLMSLYKKYAGNRESYALNNIAKLELGETKVKYEGELWQFYERDLNEFIEYNIQDTLLLEKLEQKLNYIEISINISHMGHIPYEQVYMTSRIMEGALLVYMRKNDLVAPNKPERNESLNERKLLGKFSNWKEIKDLIDIEEIEKDREYKIDISKLNDNINILIENPETNKKFEFDKESLQDLIDNNSLKLSSIGRLYVLPNIAKGAYVKNPLIGKYNWIIDLDYTSLYPSIIRTLNISPETKIIKINDWDKIFDKYLQFKENNEYSDYNITIIKREKEYNITLQQLSDLLKERDYSISINGVVYSNKKGIIPIILDMWFDERVKLKNEYKKYLTIASKYDKDSKEYKDNIFIAKQYNIKQNVIKTMLNSMYGALLLSSFRFYNKDNGEAVTTTGQKLIKYAEILINKYLSNKKDEQKDFVITMDTDSCFINVDPFVSTVEDIRLLAKDLQNYVNNSLDEFSIKAFNRSKHYFSMKQEMIANGAIFIGKKKYVLKVVERENISVNELDVKGIDIVKSNFPKYFREELRNMIYMILENRTEEQVNNKIDNIKKLMKDAKIEDIAIPTSVSHVDKYYDSETIYKKGAPINSKSAINYNILLEQFELTKNCQFISNGEKIKYVFLKENKYDIETLAFKDDSPKEIFDFIRQNVDYDRIYYGVLEKKLDRFYKALNWTERSDEIEDQKQLEKDEKKLLSENKRNEKEEKKLLKETKKNAKSKK